MSSYDQQVESALYFSATLKDKGHLFLLRELRDWGAAFFYPGADDSTFDVEEFCKEKPEERLFRFRLSGHFFNVSFLKKSPHLLLTSSADFVSSDMNAAAAEATVTLTEKIWGLLSCKYGFLDIDPRIADDKAIAALKLPYIYWMNFFGPEYVAKLGKEFLLGAPGKSTEPADGTVKYVVSDDVFAARDKDQDRAIVHYFSSKIKTKRYVQVPDQW